jgi:hypothetical protein
MVTPSLADIANAGRDLAAIDGRQHGGRGVLCGDRRGVGADYPDLAWNRQLGFFLRPGGDRTSKDPDRFARAVAISRRVQKPLYPASWLWQRMGPTDVASEALVCPDQPRSRQQ